MPISGRPRRINGWAGIFAIYKLYRYFLQKQIAFFELATVMRINASLFFKRLKSVKRPLLDPANIKRRSVYHIIYGSNNSQVVYNESAKLIV